MRRNYCQACSFARSGVKTRIAIEHTCGGRHIQRPKHQYIPTREELDKYIARLKELMEEEESREPGKEDLKDDVVEMLQRGREK